MIEELGITPEDFQKGFSDFISNIKPKKLETGTLLDNILKGGIPKSKITMMVGESNVGSLVQLYIEHLIKSKQINIDFVSKCCCKNPTPEKIHGIIKACVNCSKQII